MHKPKGNNFARVLFVLASVYMAPAGAAADSPDVSQERSISSPGCGLATPDSGTRRVWIGFSRRKYILELPDGYDPTKAYPLIFAFHGAGSDAEGFRSDEYGGLAPVVGEEAVVVYGEAKRYFTPPPLPEIPGWTLRLWDQNSSNDLDYFDTVLEEVSSEVCVDTSKIFATGHSSGAFFSSRLGCVRGKVLRGIAPLAGAVIGSMERGDCEGQVAVWIEHGTVDPRVPFERGEELRDYWLAANRCSDVATVVQSGSETCTNYTDCDEGYPVSWCVAEGGGHEPRPEFTAATSWEFFMTP